MKVPHKILLLAYTKVSSHCRTEVFCNILLLMKQTSCHLGCKGSSIIGLGSRALSSCQKSLEAALQLPWYLRNYLHDLKHLMQNSFRCHPLHVLTVPELNEITTFSRPSKTPTCRTPWYCLIRCRCLARTHISHSMVAFCDRGRVFT